VKQRVHDYSTFVKHPRYGQRPRFTDVVVQKVPGFHTVIQPEHAIDGTAIEADVNRQYYTTVPVRYYLDSVWDCVDCGRPFIFFAEEQKYWYETLRFYVWTGCKRCIDCRNRQHGLEGQRRRYEDLFHCERRTINETLEMAECSVALMENGIFHSRQTARVRMLLNSIAKECDGSADRRHNDIRVRVLAIENRNSGEQ